MSLKKNFLYSSVLTLSNYVFPLIVYPYVSRTLGLSNIGIVYFVDNLVNYFVLISLMGITTVGIREIASARNDKTKLSKTFNSLLALTTISTIVAIIVLWIAMYTIPTLTPYQDLLYVGLIKIFFNLFLIEWFFMGMENFKYITNRSLIIRCLYVLCVFILVKDIQDYKIYYVLSVAVVVANATINTLYSRKFIHYSLKAINIRPFYRPFLIMGAYALLTNVYLYLNSVWLGFAADTNEVGFFTTATKLHTIIMSILLAFTNILFPHMSNLLSEGRNKEFWEKINISFDAIFLFAFPSCIYMLIAGPELLHLVVGNGFEGSYLPLRIISPLILVIGIEQILVIQILMATHCDSIVLRNTFIGAVVSIIFNIPLAHTLGAVGSAIVWVIAESTIMCLSIISIYKKHKYSFPYERLVTYITSYIPLLVVLLFVYDYLENNYAIITVLAIITVVYALTNEIFIIKNNIAQQLVQSIHSYIKNFI